MKAGRYGETTTIQPEVYLLSQQINFRTKQPWKSKAVFFFTNLYVATKPLESCTVENCSALTHVARRVVGLATNL
jgi:hypothetical protein